MEKKRVKLLELFNVDSDKYKDLDELYVVKVDIYKAKASINIILEGIDSLKYNNSVVALVSELEKDFGTKVNFCFNGFTDENLPDAYSNIESLIRYYAARDGEGPVKNLADFISLQADIDYDNGAALSYISYINVSSGWSSMLGNEDKESLTSAINDANTICVGNEISCRCEILCHDHDMAGMYMSQDDDVIRAIEEGRMVFPDIVKKQAMQKQNLLPKIPGKLKHNRPEKKQNRKKRNSIIRHRPMQIISFTDA